eukprot:gene15927-671_t
MTVEHQMGVCYRSNHILLQEQYYFWALQPVQRRLTPTIPEMVRR